MVSTELSRNASSIVVYYILMQDRAWDPNGQMPMTLIKNIPGSIHSNSFSSHPFHGLSPARYRQQVCNSITS